VGTGAFEVAVSVPLILEYEDAALRNLAATTLHESEVTEIIDYLCSVAIQQEIFFLWRPVLRDPGDDLVLEIAVAADCDAIVTHNMRDFDGISRFGLRVITPGMFLNELREVK
jgi:predicted nucleic acid-binding protein